MTTEAVNLPGLFEQQEISVALALAQCITENFKELESRFNTLEQQLSELKKDSKIRLEERRKWEENVENDWCGRYRYLFCSLCSTYLAVYTSEITPDYHLMTCCLHSHYYLPLEN
ncbi:MAG TPA: hypothetical protein VGE97_06090 [Nitrososphaera sp.]|jgi:hypothetical protein